MVIVDTTTTTSILPHNNRKTSHTTSDSRGEKKEKEKEEEKKEEEEKEQQEEVETVYPDIRYIFSDDQFFPTIDVLNSQTAAAAAAAATTTTTTTNTNTTKTFAGSQLADVAATASGAVVVDFDETGNNILDIKSLAVNWQVAGVSFSSSSSSTSSTVAVAKTTTTTPVSSLPSASSPSSKPAEKRIELLGLGTSTTTPTVASEVQQLPPPWAEEAMQSDLVAHVLRIRGLQSANLRPPYYYHAAADSTATPHSRPSKTRDSPGAATTTTSSTSNDVSPSQLVAAFRKTNGQIRQILDLSMSKS
ncbi:hypothetical protein D0Z03_001607 [Geotrichum reessii]|nr:hypothetical protein D0Z03_001607 [Galactomyces reessii]